MIDTVKITINEDNNDPPYFPYFHNKDEIDIYLVERLQNFNADDPEEWYNGINNLSDMIASKEDKEILIDKIDLLKKANLLSKMVNWYYHNFNGYGTYWQRYLTKEDLYIETNSSKRVRIPLHQEEFNQRLMDVILKNLRSGNFKFYPVGKITDEGTMIFFEKEVSESPKSVMNELTTEFPMSNPSNKNRILPSDIAAKLF